MATVNSTSPIWGGVAYNIIISKSHILKTLQTFNNTLGIQGFLHVQMNGGLSALYLLTFRFKDNKKKPASPLSDDTGDVFVFDVLSDPHPATLTIHKLFLV